MQSEASASLARFTLATGWWGSLLAPVAGVLMFWWLPFKPVLTAYAIVVALGMVLRPVLEQVRMRRESMEIARRQVHEYYAR